MAALRPLHGLGLGLCLTLAAGAALAQPAAAAAVSVPDTLAQRLQPCLACHGPQGRANRNGYLPRIAGKPAGYLWQQLQNFRDGRRANATMADLLAHQSDACLRDMAGHFAALDLPYPPPEPLSLLPAQRARTEALVRQGDPARRLPACSACHGSALTGTLPSVPGLLGLPRDYLVGLLGAWKTGGRRAQAPDCMAQVAQALDATDIAAVTPALLARGLCAGHRRSPAALWHAALRPARRRPGRAADLAARQLGPRCRAGQPGAGAAQPLTRPGAPPQNQPPAAAGGTPAPVRRKGVTPTVPRRTLRRTGQPCRRPLA